MKNKNRKNKKGANKKAALPAPFEWNFVREAGPGCHIIRQDIPEQRILDWEKIDLSDYHPEDLENFPDIAIDPEDRRISLCNVRNDYVVAYITVFGGLDVRDKHGIQFEPGETTNNDGQTQSCTTFIILCPPQMFAHLCYVHTEHENPNLSFDDISIDSDVQVWNRHPKPGDTHRRSIGFPLAGPGPYLCTQGVGGQLTHFFSGNLHAIDFRCPVGTPLLAVGDGTVVEANDENTLTGVSVKNLFQWNSIMIQLDSEDDDPLFVEYVHIRKSNVVKGDRVHAGQVIGESGSVGFSPEPHLHFAAYRSGEATAPTVTVRFHRDTDSSSLYEPKAGLFYNSEGEANSGSVESLLKQN